MGAPEDPSFTVTVVKTIICSWQKKHLQVNNKQNGRNSFSFTLAYFHFESVTSSAESIKHHLTYSDEA